MNEVEFLADLCNDESATVFILLPAYSIELIDSLILTKKKPSIPENIDEIKSLKIEYISTNVKTIIPPLYLIKRFHLHLNNIISYLTSVISHTRYPCYLNRLLNIYHFFHIEFESKKVIDLVYNFRLLSPQQTAEILKLNNRLEFWNIHSAIYFTIPSSSPPEERTYLNLINSTKEYYNALKKLQNH